MADPFQVNPSHPGAELARRMNVGADGQRGNPGAGATLSSGRGGADGGHKLHVEKNSDHDQLFAADVWAHGDGHVSGGGVRVSPSLFTGGRDTYDPTYGEVAVLEGGGFYVGGGFQYTDSGGTGMVGVRAGVVGGEKLWVFNHVMAESADIRSRSGPVIGRGTATLGQSLQSWGGRLTYSFGTHQEILFPLTDTGRIKIGPTFDAVGTVGRDLRQEQAILRGYLSVGLQGSFAVAKNVSLTGAIYRSAELLPGDRTLDTGGRVDWVMRF